MSQLIDQHRSRQEENKVSGPDAQANAQSSDGSDENSVSANFAEVMADFKEALFNTKLTKKVSIAALPD